MTKDELNAALAKALAPVLGENAVYTRVWVCPVGHVYQRHPRGGTCRRPYWVDVNEEATFPCGYPLHPEARPVDFTDVSVLLPVMEEWFLVPPVDDPNRGYTVQAKATVPPFYSSRVWTDAENWSPGQGPSFGEALARALLAALSGKRVC